MRRLALSDDEVADALERVAELLEVQDGDIHRLRAYRRAALTARESAVSLAEVEHGPGGLESLPGIGKSLAAVIHELLHTGRSSLLERLEGQISPEDLFTTLPGVGEELAHRIHAELGTETLEELELAAHDGRLERVAGIGPRRVRGIRDSLAATLSRSTRRRARRLRVGELGASEPGAPRPSVATLLAVDAEYRRRAAAGELRRIAPRRFNPTREAWLPILHVERDELSFTALYSNTARAHELGTVRDWVVLYWERDGDEDQATVVTERRGPLAGRRVVRGREGECARHFAARAARPAACAR